MNILHVFGQHFHHQPAVREDDGLRFDRTVWRAMRVVCERFEARRPRSGLISGGFQNSRCFLPRGAPLW
jgi:hypothetical protein